MPFPAPPTPAAAAIRQVMDRRGLNVDQLATLAGVRPHVLTLILAGRRRMGWAVARKLADALGENAGAWVRLSREPSSRSDISLPAA